MTAVTRRFVVGAVAAAALAPRAVADGGHRHAIVEQAIFPRNEYAMVNEAYVAANPAWRSYARFGKTVIIDRDTADPIWIDFETLA